MHVQIDRSTIDPNELYYEDPKSMLKLFLRNNEAEMKVSFTGSKGSISSQIEVYGLKGPLFASGKGKTNALAEKDACLEACAKLDRLGILQNTTEAESESFRKMQELLKENEDDGYLDRTCKLDCLYSKETKD
jgi:hypothetical protein